MWTSIVIVMAAAAVCGDPVPLTPGPADVAHARCVEGAVRALPAHATVTMTRRDGSWAKGEVLGLDASQGMILLLPEGAPRPGDARFRSSPADSRFAQRSLPVSEVVRLEWSERRGSKITAAIAGLIIGALAGAGVGNVVAPGQQGLLDFSGFYVLGGAAVGGALGLALGIAVPSGSDESRVVDCTK